MQAIVVTFDRLATRLVGCYGNEWVETPNFDRLAATATVFDNHFADSVGPKSCRAWVTGHHAMSSSVETLTPPLGHWLNEAGVSSRLIVTDNSALALFESAGFDPALLATRHSPLASSSTPFDRVIHVAGTDGLEVEPGDVPFAKLVQAAGALLRDPEFSADKRLIWLHAPEPGLPPEGFATLYAEDFEERGFPLTEVPREDWSRQIAVAAGSMSLVDHWLGELLSQINATRQDQPTLILIAAGRGRSWTESFFVAAPSARGDSAADQLRDQETKSPLMLSILGDDRFAELSGLRCQRFVQSMDVLPTLLDWFGVSIGTEPLEGRSLLREAVSDEPARTEIYFGDDDRNIGIRTTDWNCLMRLSQLDQPIPIDVCFGDEKWPEQVQLFSKPEDIWDVTDLATQQPEVCEELVRRVGAHRRGEEGTLQIAK